MKPLTKYGIVITIFRAERQMPGSDKHYYEYKSWHRRKDMPVDITGHENFVGVRECRDHIAGVWGRVVADCAAVRCKYTGRELRPDEIT